MMDKDTTSLNDFTQIFDGGGGGGGGKKAAPAAGGRNKGTAPAAKGPAAVGPKAASKATPLARGAKTPAMKGGGKAPRPR